jgi:hypothetical protein
VEPDEASNPVDVCVLGPNAVVFKANLVSDTGEKSRGIGKGRRSVLESHFRPPIEDKRVDSGTVYAGQTY